MNPRRLALTLLLKQEQNQQYSNIALDHALTREKLSESDRALVSALVLGVTERRITLDHSLSILSSRPLSSLDADARCALRLGLYQLCYLDRIPPHAAINETVAICRKRSAGFVNAVLRSYTRLSTPIAMPDEKKEPVRALSVTYSVCEPLAEKLLSVFGYERAASYLAATLTSPPTTLRVNTLRSTKEELLSHLSGAIPTPFSQNGLRVMGALRSLFGFSEGFFFVQDEASQLAVEVLDPKRGQRVIDTCGCPGSKSFGAAIQMENEGEIFSFDLHANKLSLVVSGAERLGITILKTDARDARNPDERLFGTADRVICDVPCSGFGVLAKKPELRYKDPAVSASLPALQAEILEKSSAYLKSGGVLVYSTCTVLPEENEEVVMAFLAKHPEFSLSPFSLGNTPVPEGLITLAPDTHGTDGFFIARLVRA